MLFSRPNMVPIFFAVSLAVTSVPSVSAESIGWEIHLGRSNADSISSLNAPFEAAALSWSALPDSEITVRVRASDDGRLWPEWVTANIDDDMTVPSEGRYFTAITHFGAAKRYLEYSFSGAADRVTVTMFAPPPARGQERYATDSFTVGSVSVRSRLDWGCPDGESSPLWTAAYTTVTHAVVHHTAGANSLPDWDAELRNIWYFHTFTNGWGDIGYNFLIDPNGVVYEGRAGGDGAIGAHFSCRNTNTVGVALMGTYSNAAPTAAALESLKRLLAELVRQNGINPTEVVYHPPTGLNLPTIIGHRDGNTSTTTCSRTECPGEVLYAMLPSIRVDLACTAVAIQAHPVSTSAPAILSVTATGSEPLSYQWYVGSSGNTDAPIADATTSTLSVSPATTSSYWVRVTNPCGMADSSAAIINVSSPGRRRAVKP